MRILKHLLWLVPLLLAAAIIWLLFSNASAREAEAVYHASLTPSIQLTSSRFANNGSMSVEFSCRGEGTSPPLTWTGAPTGTRSYALLVTDWDAPSPQFRLLQFAHWVLYNIPPTLSELPEHPAGDDLRSLGITVGANSAGQARYQPPCPPLGQHQYIFRIYALDVDTLKPSADSKAGVLQAMQGHILAYGELIGLFGG